MRKFMICLTAGVLMASGCQGNTVNVYLPPIPQGALSALSQQDPGPLSQDPVAPEASAEVREDAQRVLAEPTPSPSPKPKPLGVVMPDNLSLPLVAPEEIGNWRMERSLPAWVTYSDKSINRMAVWTLGSITYQPGTCRTPEDPILSKKVKEALTFSGFGAATDSARISISRVNGVKGKRALYILLLHCRFPDAGESRNVNVVIETSIGDGCPNIDF